MSKTSVLGRGLGNLIPGSGNKNSSQSSASSEDSSSVVKEIKISLFNIFFSENLII